MYLVRNISARTQHSRRPSLRQLQTCRPQGHRTTVGNDLNHHRQGTLGDACAMAPLTILSILPFANQVAELAKRCLNHPVCYAASSRSAIRRPSSRSMSNNSSRYSHLRRFHSASAHACFSPSSGPSSHACRRFRSRSAQAAMSASGTSVRSERRDSLELLLLGKLVGNLLRKR